MPEFNQDAALDAGLRNMLVHCADLRDSESVLLVVEDPALGWYDAQLADLVAAAATQLGARVNRFEVGAPDNDPVPGLDAALAAHDCAIYLSRLGDQQRFDAPTPGHRGVMSYARTVDAMRSDFATSTYQAFVALKLCVDALIAQASEISLSCPQGTRVTGSRSAGETSGDVGLLRFPMGVHAPILAKDFAGDVALYGFLTPTGAGVYEPASISLPAGTRASIDQGRIKQWHASGSVIDAIESHYEHVASAFDLKPMHVHSWHAGIHPGCDFSGRAADDPDLWSNTVFNNPRFAHFHTCGEQAPGQICWMVLDPTIELDGVALWEKGVLRVNRFPETRRCLQDWPQLVTVMQSTASRLGIG